MIQLLARMLKVLNSEAKPLQIAGAVSLAMVAGLTPLMSLHNLLVFLLVLTLRVNLSAFLLALAFFSALGPLLDPIFHHTGLALLGLPSLAPLWTVLSNTTLGRIERIYNSVSLGSLTLALLFFYPVLRLTTTAVMRYRERLLVWIRKTRVMQLFKMSRLYRAYEALRIMGDTQ